GPHVLPAGRRGRDADHRLRREIPGRVRGAPRWKALSVRKETGGRIMADLVKFTIDGRELEAPAGTLAIEAAKRNGIEIPSFCYYEGYSLQAACRMCL